jgi:hypothetical protein
MIRLLATILLISLYSLAAYGADDDPIEKGRPMLNTFFLGE